MIEHVIKNKIKMKWNKILSKKSEIVLLLCNINYYMTIVDQFQIQLVVTEL